MELIELEDPVTVLSVENQIGDSRELPGRLDAPDLSSGAISLPLPFHLAGVRIGEEATESPSESLDPIVRACRSSSSTNGGVGEI